MTTVIVAPTAEAELKNWGKEIQTKMSVQFLRIEKESYSPLGDDVENWAKVDV